MKIAIPTRGDSVDDHFGHCEAYSIFTIDNNKQVTSKEMLPAPQGCGCKSNIAQLLHEKGVTIMLAGSMGAGALQVLKNHDIEVIRGCSGKIEPMIDAFLAGFVSDSGEGCKHQHSETCQDI